MRTVESYLDELAIRYPQLKRVVLDSINQAFLLIAETYRKRGKLLIAGNGGSAADSNHIVGELMKGFISKRPLPEELRNKFRSEWKEIAADEQALRGMAPGPVLAEGLQQALPAISLTEHASLSTAFNNDVDAKLTYAQQVLGYGKKEDVFLGLTTSGNSQNIIYAVYTAKVLGLKTIGMTGKEGGLISRIADICIKVPEKETHLVQELHLPVYHTLCMMLEREFFGNSI